MRQFTASNRITSFTVSLLFSPGARLLAAAGRGFATLICRVANSMTWATGSGSVCALNNEMLRDVGLRRVETPDARFTHIREF